MYTNYIENRYHAELILCGKFLENEKKFFEMLYFESMVKPKRFSRKRNHSFCYGALPQKRRR